MSQPAANPASAAPNQLDMLKDIHLPSPIEQFQLAPGWWLLIAIAFMTLVYIITTWNKRRKALSLLKPANSELDKIASAVANNQSMAELSALLKRICLMYFPKNQVAALSGEQWTKFLNQQVGTELFNESQQIAFSQLAYRADHQIEQDLWLEIISNSRTAIDKIIRNSAKKSTRTTQGGQLK